MMSITSSPLKRPVSPQEALHAVVVIVVLVVEMPGDAPVGPDRVFQGAPRHVPDIPQRPSREGATALLDVVLGVVPDAHREQLQQLPAEVLVDRSVVIVVVVQPEDHGRVLGHLDQQVLEPPEAVLPEHVDLNAERPGLVRLAVRGREYAVPEERDLLLQRTPGRDHPVEPLGGGAVRSARLVYLRVVTPDDVQGHVLRVARRQQVVDRRLIPPGRVLLELAPRRAEPGAAHEMRHQLDVVSARHVAHRLMKSNCSKLPLTIGTGSRPSHRSSMVE